MCFREVNCDLYEVMTEDIQGSPLDFVEISLCLCDLQVFLRQ